MITNITLENFKCFRQVSINPKLLTVLIGPNGTGKSSVLQALLLLKQSVDSHRLNHSGEFINLNSPGELSPSFLTGTRPRFSLAGELREGMFKYSQSFLHNVIPVDDVESYPRTPDFEDMLVQLKFVPALRGLVKPTHKLGSEYKEHLTLQHGLDIYVEQLATNLAYSRPLEQELSRKIERITGTGLRAESVPSRNIEVKSIGPSGAVNIVAEGFGANSLILLLHQLVNAEGGATVLIEEPEIHLHPKAQADLAEVLAETAKAEDKQIIMTTHSEHLVERLLTLVAEGKLTPYDLAIYSFEKDEKGECSASELVVTERGQTEGGLTGFFDNNLAEMDRYVKALQGRS